MCSATPQDWKKWLPLAEWWFNTHYHTATKLTPYEVVYNQPPPLHLPYLAGEAIDREVDRNLQRRENMISELKIQLQRAQHRMKHYADMHRSERVFDVGDWVWLKLVAYKQGSLHHRSNHKLSPKFYGPFQVVAKIGKVAYKLKLPTHAKIHDVFHVSQLKQFRGTLPVATEIPSWFSAGQHLVPQAVLDRRMRKFQNKAKVEYLVHWEGQDSSQATWEDAHQFCNQYPAFIVQT